jgi:hypothetical protein
LKKLNILTRTSGRPKFFNILCDDIDSQTYENINHIVCADDEDSYDYARKRRENVILIDRPENKTEYGIWHSPYNPYINTLMDKVEDGWILFLDDDDHFKSDKSVETLMKLDFDEDSLVIFKTEFPNKILPSYSFGKCVQRADITSNSFIFHSKHKWAAQWDEVKEADYRCAQKLSLVNNKIVWVDFIFTVMGNKDHNGCGGLGKRRDYNG